MSWFDYINSAGIIGALGIGAYQTRNLARDARGRDEDRRTERALELYRDVVVEGDTANAFHRLSVLLRHKGAERYKVATWFVMTDAEFDTGGILDPSLTGLETPFEDFYRVIWFFERADNALRFNLLSHEVFFRTVGFHCWWWGQLLSQIDTPKAMKSLRELAPQASDWAKSDGVYASWLAHCSTDFNGGPGDVGITKTVPTQGKGSVPSQTKP